MPRAPLPPITETLEELRQRLQAERHAERKRRLHMLLLFKEDPTRTREAVAQHLAASRNTIGRWLRRYARGGLEALLSIERRGPKPGQRTVPRPVYVAIQKRLRQPEGFAGYKQLQQWIYEAFGLEVPYKSVYNLVRYHLGAKLKVPRPVHPKKA